MKFCSFLLLASAFLVSSCSNNSDSSPPTITETTTPISIPERNPTDGSHAFELAEVSFTSASLFAAECNEGGDTTTAVGTATYTADKMFCSFAASSNQRGTMRGSYFASTGVLCALEKKIALTYPATPVVYNNIIISESDGCFQGYDYDLNKDGDVSDEVSVSLRESKITGDDYEQLLQVQFDTEAFDESGASSINLYMKNSGSIIAAKTYETTSVTEVIVDTSTGTLNYESRDYALDVHIRTLLKGEMDPKTGSIGAMEKLQTIQAFGNRGDEKHSITYSSNGHNTRYDHFVGTTRARDYNQCVGDCTEIYLIPYLSDFHNFTLNPQTQYDHAKMMVTPTDITMDF